MGVATIEPATHEDFEDLAKRSTETPRLPPVRTVAFAGKVDGRVVAIGGIAFWPNGLKQAFLDVGTEARNYPVTLHKAGLKIVDLARDMELRQVYAVADEPKDVTIQWLLRLGFRPIWTPKGWNYVLFP